ncbi:MAG: murein biosynthesis integral membrane protein MurJ [Myxococcales bacterium]|nr:murein biosynthesis integral membrane protein MurJ [Myxococcales bacterium]USN51054.1 MAG: murein biosynthesis integral membrane protein MurJ [Myxococcales bacterium]
MKEALSEQMADVSLVEGVNKRRITIGALIQAIYTLMSRIAGMIRDVLTFHIFGVGAFTDAFNIAFTIPNVLRRFFAEGAFAVAFVPVFMTSKEKEGKDHAHLFFRDAFGFLVLLVAVVCIVGIVFSPLLVKLFAYGFSYNPEQFALTNIMTKWFFPYVFMVSIVALFGAYLQCHNRFSAMAAAPIFLNLGMILAMCLCAQWFNPPIMVLCLGVLLGGVLQCILLFISLKQAGLWAWPRFCFNTKAMKHLIRLLGPALFGVFVYQLNIMVLRQLASFLGEGQISYYYNADRLTQFATGVFGVSIATAAMPELSKGAAQIARKTFFDTLRFTLLITSFVITPSAIGLMVFAYPIVSVLYVHGAFTSQDAMHTAHTLIAFAPSLVAFSLSRPVIQAFYAQSDTRTPVLVGIITVFLNLGFGLMLIKYEIMGLAATLSISSFIQYFILLYLFKKKSNNDFYTALLKPLLAHAALALGACAVALFPAKLANWHEGFCTRNAVVLVLSSCVAGLSYLSFAYVFKLDEARKFIHALKVRLFK